ncbi:MAG: leucine-rich repeat protein [Clostridium sp.]|nr:leucine-rich repeat protein [Clostridium sp.]
MKKRWKGIRTLCLVVCGLMMAGVSVKADNGLGVTKHTKKEIATYLEESQKSISNRILYKTSPAINDLTRLDAIGELAEETCNSALARFNQYRYIAGLNALTINDTYSDYAQAAAFINACENNGDGGVIYSYPKKPEAMTSDKLYNYCAWGVRYSNILARAQWLVPAIDEWMKDEDSDILFSRRRMMKPSLTQVGFGYARNGYDYAAVYTDYIEETAVMNVAWPAQVMPISFFNTSEKWTFSTGNIENIANIHVTVTRLNDNKSWTFDNSKGLTVNNQMYGQRGCLIFQPSLNSLSAGDKFQVHITGLADGDVTYYVEFFDPNNYEEEPECSKHYFDANGKCTNCDKNVGSIVNKNFRTSYIYNGSAISEPLATNFIIPEGAATPTFTWYDGDQTAISDLNAVALQKRNTMPVDAGTYTLVVETPPHDTTEAEYDASSIRIKVVIAKATPTDYIKPTGLTAKCGDKLSAVSLKVNNTNEKGSFVWTDSDVELKAGSNEQGQTIQKTAKYIPTDTKNYNEVEGIVLSIQVTHQAVTDSAVAATCETEGKTAGKHCSACSTIFVRQETIQPLKHHYNADGRCTKCDKNIGTITNNNYKTVYEYCGYAISKPVPANFTFPSGAASPVFTWYNGDQTGVADLNTVSAQKIANEPVDVGTYTLIVEAPAHDTTEAKYDASNLRVKVEIKKGNPTGYIKPTELTAKCGDLLSAVSLKVNDENEKGSFVWTDSNVKLEAGSDVNGQTITKKAKYVPADTNNYNEVDGIELSIKIEHELKGTDTTSHNATCTSCGKAFSLSTCVGGKATCTSPAICSICGQPYGDVDTENGHEYEPAYNWSDNGESCTIALVCKRKECSESVPNHKLTRMCMVTSKVTQEATCTEVEKTMRTATYSFYDKEYKVSKVFDTRSALGHQEVEDPAVEATCEKEGKTAGKHCSVCKTLTLEQKVVPATGQHSWDEGKITKEPTKTEEGIKTYTCTSCQQTKWETIPKLNGDSDNPGGNTGDSGNTDNPGGNTGDSGNTDNPGGNTGDNGNPSKPGGDTDDGQQPSAPSDTTGGGQQPSAPSDTTGGGQQPSAPTDNTETVKVGMVTSDDKAAAKYQITNVDKKEVSFVKPVNKKAKKITVPNTVKIDGKTYKVTCVSGKTFSGANKCKTIIIGKNVTSIKANAFSGCKNVKTIIFKTTKLTKKTVAKNAFKGITKKTTIKVPKKKVSSYKKIFKSKGLSSKVKVKA